MEANKTHTPPPVFEELGDGTYYYNFNVEKSENQTEESNNIDIYNYNQVRCQLPINLDKLRLELDKNGFTNHIISNENI